MPMGLYGGSMVIYSGAIVGAVVQTVAVSQAVKRARLSRFPLAGRMMIGLSARRILVWRAGGFVAGSISRFVGHVPLSRISRIELESVACRSKLTFVLRDARPVTIEADTRDDPHRFVEAFYRGVAGGVSEEILQARDAQSARAGQRFTQPSSGPSPVLPA
jgi:hypothetical protein